MPQNKNISVQTAELLPPESRKPIPDADLLEKLVQQKVAEILANREDLLLRPFFDERRVADELRRLQKMPFRRKWSVYFATYGCLICKTKKAPHRGCGLCPACYQQTTSRLRTAIGEPLPSRRGPQYIDNPEAVARKALLDAVESFRVKDGRQ